ncbi:acidic amino acid decarboxylase [Skeletonema marinoi]|uniref:Acidic amino acid decarboxylase n=1 Tax=Skeletonema marinoi TaxID=267567 RepID=A0AAD8YDB4_9STRA|nr:acidic amino acid decarboxylase [Skeletonema marinoi]
MFAKPPPPSTAECLPSTSSSSSWISSFLGIANSQPQNEPLGLSLTISVSSLIQSLIFVLMVGACLGIWINRRFIGAQDVHLLGADENKERLETTAADASTDGADSQSNDSDCKDVAVNNNDEDGPTMVLRGSLDLLASKWGVDRGTNGEHNNDNDDNDDDAVVRYLSPEQMTNLLFAKPTNDNVAETLCLDEVLSSSTLNNNEGPSPELLEVLLTALQHSPKSSATDITSLISSEEGSESSDHDDVVATTATDKSIIAAPSTSSFTSTTANSNTSSSPQQQPHMSPQQFTNLLSLIQKYSVNTSHPYFFNQLFGSLDPIALAAEIVALSVNTSVYTYETAPVFTLVEREVMGQIGKLVFGSTNDEDNTNDEVEEFVGEGLMIPGGSLANLTAMHAARHRWKVVNGYTKQQQQQKQHNEYRQWLDNINETSEEKKQQQQHLYITNNSADEPQYDLVAFVSSEAHYSFAKSARVLGLREDDLIVIPTNADGSMNVEALAKSFDELECELEQIVREEDGAVVRSNSDVKRRRRRVPFFVACTAGSTVRGSFDDIAKIVEVCPFIQATLRTIHLGPCRRAWGGSAIFSSRNEIRSITHMDEIRHADSFTFNPHKMLGAPQQTTAFIVRHRNGLREANAAGAKYLFDPRKNGAEYDLGDLSYTCGRRTDAVKLWAMWKYYGRSGLGSRVDQKVDELECFVKEVRKRRNTFALACRPWPFNVNFFYFPPRIREVLEQRGILRPVVEDVDDMSGGDDENSFIQIPDDIAKDLAEVSVALKLRLHEAGEMIIPYQPLSNQQADCFRLVVAGKKDLKESDICHILDTMEKYGADL